MPKFYKYRNFDNMSAPENEHFTNNIILNSSLFFSPIKNFNDPFDCQISYRQEYSKSEIRQFHIHYLKRNPDDKTLRLKDFMKKYGNNEDFVKLQNQLTNKLISKIGVLSLSTNPNSILMWSHYANNHTGLVFQFTPIKTSKCFDLYNKIDYEIKYDLLSYVTEDKNEITKLLLTKHKDWKYESEFRVIDMDYQGEKEFYKQELTSIIFGALSKKEDIERTINLCKNNGFEHVKFSKAELSHGEFSLKFREIIVGK